MPAALDRAIALVASGQDVDWDLCLRQASDTWERRQIEDLQLLARLSGGDLSTPRQTDPALTVGVPNPTSASPGIRWGHLELVQEIGRGAHGVVWRAWDTRLARAVAVKILGDDEHGQSSIEEARRLARIVNPHVVSVYGADRIDGRVGVWMELLSGRTLEDIVRDQGPFSSAETVGIAIDICRAVAAIHQAGLIHRDLKAQNVMRESGGRLVVMDLGASLAIPDLESAALAGTPLYMAPELFEGGAPSAASDIYAIGVLMYRLVTASFPIEARTLDDVRRAHDTSRSKRLRDIRPDVPSDFVRIVEQCLAREQTSRFSSVAALEQALLELGRGRANPVRRLRPLTIVGALTLAAGLGAIAGRLSASGRTSPTSDVVSIDADQYKLFAGYEELAFGRRT
jgi:serine/threonine protein kinase